MPHNPKTKSYWIQKGHDLKSNGFLTESVDAYLQATRIEGADAEAWRFLGNAYYKLENYQRALEVYRVSAECNPDEPKIWMNLANTYKKLGFESESRSSIEAAERLSRIVDHQRGEGDGGKS